MVKGCANKVDEIEGDIVVRRGTRSGAASIRADDGSGAGEESASEIHPERFAPWRSSVGVFEDNFRAEAKRAAVVA